MALRPTGDEAGRPDAGVRHKKPWRRQGALHTREGVLLPCFHIHKGKHPLKMYSSYVPYLIQDELMERYVVPTQKRQFFVVVPAQDGLNVLV